MARRYFISAPVSNGEFLSELMSGSYEDCQMAFIHFFSDEYQTLATPSGGQVDFTLSPDGEYFKTVDSGSFPAAESYKIDRTPPNANGLAVRAKITLDGVVGATHFTACVWRS